MKSKALRIGLIGSGDDSSSKLLRLLVEQGMQVVHALVPKELTDAHITATDLDVWLLDLDDSHWHDKLDELMDRSSVPIFFNEHQSIEDQQHLDYWCRNLISRMFELVGDVPGMPASPAAPVPPAAARNGDTLHIAFPQGSPQKAESRPSDDLTPVPTALDPALLQEIEELEELLQSKAGNNEAELAELDALLPAMQAEPKPIAPATPEKSVAEKPTAAKPAAEKTATPASTKESVKESKKESVATTPAAPTSAPAMPSDPQAAAKARAAQIQQQIAAAQQKAGPATTQAKPSAVDATAAAVTSTKPSSPMAVATGVTESPVVTPSTTKATPTATKPAAPANIAPTKPVESAPKAAAPTAPVVAKPASSTPKPTPAAATTSVTAPTEKVATEKTAAEKPVIEKPATEKTPTSKAGPSVAAPLAREEGLDSLSLDALSSDVPPALPPEKHDWPSFPPAPIVSLSSDEASADFAPMQPQPAPGPMRESARPTPVTLVRSTPAAANDQGNKPASGAAPAGAKNKADSTAAAPYSEPVPTLTITSSDDLEFEAVNADAPHEEVLPHVELDVPMLESVAIATEFEAVTDLPPALPCDLWVLGASLGGPAALKRFFAALNQPLPICFLLAQHIDAHFLPVLGKILEQANPFYPVQVLVRPGLIEPGSLLLAPIEKRLRFLEAGQIVHGARAWTPPYSPCIDDVLSDVASAYPGQVHTIVFSGMGEDGINGARALVAAGGEVWIQDADSCASSVMPDAIDNAGLADVRATPEELAERLMARYNSAIGSQSLA